MSESPPKTSQPKQALFLPGILAQQEGQFVKAIDYYKQHLKQYPQNPELNQLLGISYLQQQDFKNSIAHLQAASTLDPENPTILANLAKAYRLTGNISLAKHILAKALTIEPHHLSTLNNLGRIHYSEREIEKAMHCFEKALNVFPGFLDARFNLALCHLAKHNFQQAIPHLTHIIDQDPKYEKALSQLGQVYMQQEAFLPAQLQFDQLITLNPAHAQGHHQLGIIHLKLGNDTKGLAHLQKAHRLDPTLESIDHNLASAYLHQRSYSKALQHWLKQQEKTPDSMHLYNCAVCYLYLGRYEQACDYFYEVLRQDPMHFASLTNLGACYLQQNKPHLAVPYYKRAQTIKHSDTSAFILKALGEAETFEAQRAPDPYVKELFDHYAYHYDDHLTKVLDFKVPELLKKLLITYQNPQHKSLSALDLGCGTGLSGKTIHPFCKTLHGIDLSENMLEQAKKKAIYDQLIQASLPQGLENLPFESYDLIIASDLLPYFGCLEALFVASAQRLKPGGHFIFSHEKTYQSSYILQQSARYAHHPEYIVSVAKSSNLTRLCFEEAKLRTQQKAFVEGHLVLLSKPL